MKKYLLLTVFLNFILMSTTAQARMCSGVLLSSQIKSSREDLISTLQIENLAHEKDPLAAYEREMSKYGEFEFKKVRAQYAHIIKFPELVKHGSSFFHGSRSSSLMSLLQKDPADRGLLPSYVLLKSGKVPFVGEMENGIAHEDGVNRDAISATDFTHVLEAVEYAKVEQEVWTPEASELKIQMSQKSIKDNEGEVDHLRYMSKMIIKIEKARLKRWKTLSALEKELIQNDFPVIYGLKPAAEKIEALEGKYGPTEYKLMGGVTASEIRVLFVPSQHIDYVQSLLKEYNIEIPVESIDPILQKDPGRLNFFIEYLR